MSSMAVEQWKMTDTILQQDKVSQIAQVEGYVGQRGRECGAISDNVAKSLLA